MNFVIDASVAAKWLVPEVDSDKAEDILLQWRRKAFDLSCPDLVSAEIANTLWKRVVQRKLPAATAAIRYRDFTDLRIPLEPTARLIAPALDVALRYRCSVYDSIYITLALDVGWDFITADKRLYNAVRSGFPGIRLLSDWT